MPAAIAGFAVVAPANADLAVAIAATAVILTAAATRCFSGSCRRLSGEKFNVGNRPSTHVSESKLLLKAGAEVDEKIILRKGVLSKRIYSLLCRNRMEVQIALTGQVS